MKSRIQLFFINKQLFVDYKQQLKKSDASKKELPTL